MKYYVVNYKNTYSCCGSINEVISGVYGFIYTEEKDAIQKCYELTDDIFNKHLEEFDENEDEILKGECDDFCRDSDENGSYQCIRYYGDTFEYWVTDVVTA